MANNDRTRGISSSRQARMSNIEFVTMRLLPLGHQIEVNFRYSIQQKISENSKSGFGIVLYQVKLDSVRFLFLVF